ncbi:MAG TPA: response regulator [Phycisphaerales bacterium]|nr:response regulator [Phycisphaerales bacterium]
MATILLVEPAALVREPLAEILQTRTHTVTTVTSPAEALAIISVNAPDLIITELTFGQYDGVGFIRNVRNSPKTARTPVLVLAGAPTKAQLVNTIKLGINGFMLKNRFSIAEFLQKIETALKPPQEAPAPLKIDPSKTGSMKSPVAVTANKTRSIAPAAPIKPGTQHSAADDAVELLKSLRPIVNRTEIQECIDKGGEVKALSPAVGHLLKLTNSEGASMDQIVEAVRMDHAIALKMLKMANSAVYTRGEPVDSIRKAVLRIGTDQIRQAVLNIAVIERFSNPELSKFLDCNQFWEHAIGCGLIATTIARAAGSTDADSAFTMGLLHDAGRMVLAEQLGERYVHVLRTAREMNLPLEYVEKRMLLFNHAEVMDRVLHSWNFPKQLINPIVFHHLSAANLRAMSPSELRETTTLALANRLAHALLLGSSGNMTIYPTAELRRTLGLQESVIEEIERDIPSQTDEMKFAMLSFSNVAAWPQARESVRGSLGAHFRPLYIGADEPFDALRIFCKRVAGEFADEAPTIAIVEIPNAAAIPVVSKRLKDLETTMSGERLPVVVVSPSGKLIPEAFLLAGRAHERLQTPFVIERFTAACGRLLAPANGGGAAEAPLRATA